MATPRGGLEILPQVAETAGAVAREVQPKWDRVQIKMGGLCTGPPTRLPMA
jgi:hypothetical protein